jgi:RNA polymerase-binding transcription factor DksA
MIKQRAEAKVGHAVRHARADHVSQCRDDIRRGLLAHRYQLLSQVARVEDDLDWLASNVESEVLEEGQEQALANVLERLDEHDRCEIAAINYALERMGRGDYGICRMCRVKISRARLDAVPTADLCRACAESREAL